MTIYRPKYGPGCHIDTRSHWNEASLQTLRELMAFASQDFAADVLGRDPFTLTDKIRNLRWVKPKTWRRRQSKTAIQAPGQLMQYPYVAKASIENSQVLEVNTLVARAYPEHMRADLCQEIMVALLQGETTVEKLRARGIKAFVTQWRKSQREDEYWPSLDAPRENGHAWHEVLSDEHSIWLGQCYYVDTGPARFRNIMRAPTLGKRRARKEQEDAFAAKQREHG